MPFKLLTDLYFDNKVQVIPSGAMSFFGYLYKLENIIKTPGLINLEEADLQTIVFGAKKITIINLESKGKDKGTQIGNKLKQLIPEARIQKGVGAIFHVIGNSSLTLYEVNDVAEGVYTFLNDDANIIFGATIDEKLKDTVQLLLLLAE
ncbi:MAG: hypothetical protein NT099_00220 [Candidatus Saganbacteria bacterium]|nr:hypothetical protein [Candidatus Saganbacteria bacterium]